MMRRAFRRCLLGFALCVANGGAWSSRCRPGRPFDRDGIVSCLAHGGLDRDNDRGRGRGLALALFRGIDHGLGLDHDGPGPGPDVWHHGLARVLLRDGWNDLFRTGGCD